jgi:hypothetical protein
MYLYAAWQTDSYMLMLDNGNPNFIVNICLCIKLSLSPPVMETPAFKWVTVHLCKCYVESQFQLAEQAYTIIKMILQCHKELMCNFQMLCWLYLPENESVTRLVKNRLTYVYEGYCLLGYTAAQSVESQLTF